MQGYILNINKVKDEDLIVTILTDKNILNLYRFYGSRHSTIQLGYKIDFEVVQSAKSTISLLRNVLHLPNKWEFEREKIHHWQTFIKLLNVHLKDIENIDDYFIKILDLANSKLTMQNPKRTLIESYIDILKNEGRLQDEFECIICSNEIKDEKITLLRAFMSAHESCLRGITCSKEKMLGLFTTQSTIDINDEMIDRLWNVLLEGL